MHSGEVDTDVPLVRRLLAGQFRQWASLPLQRVLSAGTDNAIYRLGDRMAVRLPRIMSVALIALPYYEQTNPVMVANARRRVVEVLTDH